MSRSIDVLDSILHPLREPYRTGRLAVDARHTLYYEECGRPDGLPVLFVHGGPGAGCSPADRRFFDPERFRAILVDQRGAGHSLPSGEIHDNTPDHLVRDFELLRKELRIERWHVFGGSWGSTLGLYYAQACPERVLSLTLRGIWLFRQYDVDWWFYGLKAVHPELWHGFAEHLPPAERSDLLEGYHRRLFGKDRALALAAARVWSVYEGSACTLLPNPDFTAAFATDEMAWCLARLEAHYFKSCRFRPDDLLLERIDRIRSIPTFLVHGRYDVVCPIEAADALQRAWPECYLAIVPDAGHASREPGTARELVRALDRILATGDPRPGGPGRAVVAAGR